MSTAGIYRVDYEGLDRARRSVDVEAIGPQSAMVIARLAYASSRVCSAYKVDPMTGMRIGPSRGEDGRDY